MTHRNIVQITCDSVRADHCSWLESDKTTTPVLNSFSDDAITFETAIAPGPRTPSSVPIFQTGTHFAKNTNPTSRTQRIREHIDEHGTIAQDLNDKEYTTIAFSVNPWTFGDSGFRQDFDKFVEVGNDKGGWLPDLFEDTRFEAPAQYLDFWLYDKSWFCTWHTFFDDLIESISDTTEPYYVWIFLMDSHNPFLVPRSDRQEANFFEMYYSFLRGNSFFNHSGQSAMDAEMSEYVYDGLIQSYRDSIRSVDHFIGELWNEICDDDPILVFHSDHGEAFGEHGSFGHQQSLYEENVRVPLLVYNVDEPGEISDPFGLVDLPELLTAYATESNVDPARWGSEYAYSRTEDEHVTAVRGKRWKLVHTEAENTFYDLCTDPVEQEPNPDTAQGERQRFENALDEFLGSLRTSDSGGPAVEEDKDVQNLLSSLGYLNG